MLGNQPSKGDTYLYTWSVPQSRLFGQTIDTSRSQLAPDTSTPILDNIVPPNFTHTSSAYRCQMSLLHLTETDLLITLFLLCPNAEDITNSCAAISGTESNTTQPKKLHGGRNTTHPGTRHPSSTFEEEILRVLLYSGC